MSRLVTALLSITAIGLLSACTNTVKYGEVSKAETIQAEIGTADLQQITQRLVNRLISYPTFKEVTKNKRPLLAVDKIVDQTNDHLDIDILHNTVLKQLGASGKVRFVDSSKVEAARVVLKDELDFGALNEQTAPKVAEITDSELVLYGTVANIIRIKPNSKEVYFRVTLNLWDQTKGQLIWQDYQEQLKSQKKVVFGI